jgi:hypothetical protein
MAKSSEYYAVTRRNRKSSANANDWVSCLDIDGKRFSVSFPTEREVALFVDRKLIEHGLPPRNILKNV